MVNPAVNQGQTVVITPPTPRRRTRPLSSLSYTLSVDTSLAPLSPEATTLVTRFQRIVPGTYLDSHSGGDEGRRAREAPSILKPACSNGPTVEVTTP